MKVLIIDDEAKARKLLKAMIYDCDENIEIVADCDDLPSGIKAIKKFAPDLIFLDIEMPAYSGLELMDFFNEDEVNFSVIFTTAYSQYALQAFRFSAIDYLLKPLNINLLKEAIERFKRKNAKETQNLFALKHNLENSKTKKIGIPQANGIRFVSTNDILFAKGEGAYTEIYLLNEEKILISRNLKYLEDLLEGVDVLVRCQKSYIVNTNFITAYIKQDGGYLLVADKHHVSISTDKIDQILSLIKV